MASASAYWPYTAYTGYPYMAGYHMPYTYTAIKPEEYTKTFEYKNGLPFFWGNKIVKMPELETDYANKGEYKAEAAGGVVHMAKREAEAEPWMFYNNWAGYSMPLAYNYGYMPYAAHYPIVPVMPKLVTDDRMKADTPDYANKGEYVADNGAIVHLAKREAEADPALLYSSFAYPYAFNRAYYTAAPVARTYTTLGYNNWGLRYPYAGLWY